MKIDGLVQAVCISTHDGVPKHYVREVIVSEFGFDGDYHCKPTSKDYKNPGQVKPNTGRHVLIVAQEVMDSLNESLGISLSPGSLGENILSYGLGELTGQEIPNGTILRVGKNVLLQVTKQNAPCDKLLTYHPEIKKYIAGRRGILCAVVGGIGERLGRGDWITIEK